MATPLVVSEVFKSFTMHLRDGIKLPVVKDVNFSVASGECVVLGGPSGIGKSSILKMLYGNYAVDAGQILVAHRDRVIDLASADPRTVLGVRRDTMGYVSQFLRTVPRGSALDVVAEPLVARGSDVAEARDSASSLLSRLNLPQELWSLPPATFSGGEQQRVNIARGFISDLPILLLDEPTASLDPDTADWVRQHLQDYRKAHDATILLASHNMLEVERLCDRVIIMKRGRIEDDDSPDQIMARYNRATLEEVFLDVARGRVREGAP